jgi:hypothetical protein
VGLFKGDWIAEQGQLKTLARQAAWCAEIHEQLRELEGQAGVQLILMGGQAVSLRFDALKQRLSTDNDYLTCASKTQIQALMDAFAGRFAAVHPMLLPRLHRPSKAIQTLDMATYVIPISPAGDRGPAANREVKLDFHFETDLPPTETLSGSLGAAGQLVHARVTELPYQCALKLVTLASAPVGIDEDNHPLAVPRQLYDVDLLLRALADEAQWDTMCQYYTQRYVRQCALVDAVTGTGESASLVEPRLARWARCTERASRHWKRIRSVQQAQLHREAHCDRWGWRARCRRVALAIECMGEDDGWELWQQALATAALALAPKRRIVVGSSGTTP